jgi:neutral trehalase
MEIAGFLPLWAGIVPEDRRAKLLARLSDPSVFLRPAGVASLAATDPSFAPGATGSDRWNGPVYVPWQWLVVRGLRASGETALADEITRRVQAAVRAQLAEDHLFRELYDADETPAPNASMPNYLWSSMGALMALEAGAR